MEMDPDLKETDPIPGFNSNRKQNMENLPEEKDQTIRRTSIGTNSDNDDDFKVPLDFPSISANEEDIIKVSREVRRLTAGGLQKKQHHAT